MTKHLIHSHSSLSMHKKCPEQFNQVRVLKRFPYVPSKEATRGTLIHAAFEALGKHGVPMPEELKHLQWAFDEYAGRFSGDKHYEHGFDFTADGVAAPPTDWSAKHYTGQADVLIINGNSAFVGDYKTGKANYPDIKQLERMAVFTMWAFPQVETVVGALLFVEHQHSTDPKAKPVVVATYTRTQLPEMVALLEADAHFVERDALAGTWETRPSALCPWCPVTECENWTPPKPKK
jgi:RecB family exonuclease